MDGVHFRRVRDADFLQGWHQPFAEAAAGYVGL
jgi:hypothetical protein